MTPCEMIEKAMRKKGYSVRNLYDQLPRGFIALQHLYRIKDGKVSITPQVAYHLANALDIDGLKLLLADAKIRYKDYSDQQ